MNTKTFESVETDILTSDECLRTILSLTKEQSWTLKEGDVVLIRQDYLPLRDYYSIIGKQTYQKGFSAKIASNTIIPATQLSSELLDKQLMVDGLVILKLSPKFAEQFINICQLTAQAERI